MGSKPRIQGWAAVQCPGNFKKHRECMREGCENAVPLGTQARVCDDCKAEEARTLWRGRSGKSFSLVHGDQGHRRVLRAAVARIDDLQHASPARFEKLVTGILSGSVEWIGVKR